MASSGIRLGTVSLIIVLLVQGIITTGGADENEFVNTRKTWWVKRITDDVYTSGRLSFRQIKYLSEVGFKSVISMFKFHQRGMLGDEVLPNSRESYMAAHLAGMHRFIELLQSEENVPHQWANAETVGHLALAMRSVRKPVLICSKDGFAATLIAYLYLASNNSNDTSFSQLNTDDIVALGASHGYDYSSIVHPNIIPGVTGGQSKQGSYVTDVTIANWSRLWLIKPVISNWYVAGQIQKNHVGMLKELGFVSIVNSRKRVTDMLTGAPAQEEVTLLNIRDDLLTKQGRQKLQVLEANRIDPNKSNEYISHDSRVNYESRNYAEYGDAIGYNETLERIHVARNSLDYLSTPLDVDGPFPYTVEIFDKYKESILNESKKGNVLVHCASGHRAGILVLALAGLEHQKNSTWALRRARELGYTYTSDAVIVLRTILDNRFLETTKQTRPFSGLPRAASTIDLILYACSGVVLAAVCIAGAVLIRKVIMKKQKAKCRHRYRLFDDTPPLLRTTDM